jgi:hypothetical protein
MDKRSDLQKRLDAVVGPPLYYCDTCKLSVSVKARDGQEPLIERPCEGACSEPIIAPRKAIAAGKGGLNMRDKAKLSYWQLAAALTGRCV